MRKSIAEQFGGGRYLHSDITTKVHKSQHWMCHWFSQTQTIKSDLYYYGDSWSSCYCYAQEMCLILQSVIAFLPYAYDIPDGSVRSHLGERHHVQPAIVDLINQYRGRFDLTAQTCQQGRRGYGDSRGDSHRYRYEMRLTCVWLWAWTLLTMCNGKVEDKIKNVFFINF